MNVKSLSINSLVEYDYLIGEQLLESYDLRQILTESAFQKGIFLIDENVWKYHKTYLEKNLLKKFSQNIISIIPSGESSKSLAKFNQLTEELLSQQIDRSCPLFAIGGGVTGDLGGYVASSLLRGLPFVQVPTTSLAMVDSAIGGKTGINSASGKNLIGAFYQPLVVLADLNLLKSLPKREMLCGISETIKHGAIAQPELIAKAVNWLNDENSENLADLLFKSASVKIDIVIQDVLEKGIRANLNLGHTFGHAIEASAGYGCYLHGEAVFLGILAADYAASRMLNSKLHPIWDSFIPHFKPFIKNKAIESDVLIPFMYKDKKTMNGKIKLILTKNHGSAELVNCDDMAIIRESFSYAFAKFDKA